MSQCAAHVIIGSQICKWFIEHSWQYEAATLAACATPFSRSLPLFLSFSLSVSHPLVILVNAMPIKPLLDGAVYFDTA